jgi:hypothetical protein
MTIGHTGRIVATGTNGKRHHVNIFTEYVSTARDLGGDSKELEGMKRLKLDDGTLVNRIEQGRYQTVGLFEVELTSDDPDAV